MKMSRKIVPDLAIGLTAGLFATALTGPIQSALYRITPASVKRREEQVRPGSPTQVVAKRLAGSMDVRLSKEQTDAAATAIHYGSGIPWGAAYTFLRRYSGMTRSARLWCIRRIDVADPGRIVDAGNGVQRTRSGLSGTYACARLPGASCLWGRSRCSSGNPVPGNRHRARAALAEGGSVKQGLLPTTRLPPGSWRRRRIGGQHRRSSGQSWRPAASRLREGRRSWRVPVPDDVARCRGLEHMRLFQVPPARGSLGPPRA